MSTDRDNPGEKLFRISVRKVWRWQAVVMALILPLIYFSDSNRSWQIALAAFAVGLVTSGFGSFQCAVRFPTRVNSEGIQSYNLWGQPVRVAWNKIKSVRRFNYPGLPYALIKSDGKSDIWLPLFHAGQNDLAAAVASLAPPNHPLTRFLQGEQPQRARE